MLKTRGHTIIEGIHLVGAVCLTSLLALKFQIAQVMPAIPTETIAVLAFHVADGRVHHPPAGDQTSLGSVHGPASSAYVRGG